jgi:hypothetical protein
MAEWPRAEQSRAEGRPNRSKAQRTATVEGSLSVAGQCGAKEHACESHGRVPLDHCACAGPLRCAAAPVLLQLGTFCIQQHSNQKNERIE